MPTLKLGPEQDIYYEQIPGERESPCLVFLHEGLGCTEIWKGFPRTLCSKTRCSGLVYDRLGYGKSSPALAPRAVDFLHKSALVEMPQVISRLIPRRNYFLLGHSDGGSISLIHASQKPRRLLGIVAEAAHVTVEEKALVGIRVAREAFAAGRLRGLTGYHGERAEGILKAWADTWLSDWFRQWNIEGLLPLIECPTLVIQGTEDQYATIAQVESIVSRVHHAEKSIIEGCGHAPHIEKANLVSNIMAEFIGRHARDEAP